MDRLDEAQRKTPTAWLEQGQPERARAECERRLRNKSATLPTVLVYALALKELGEQGKAEAVLKQAEEIHSKNRRLGLASPLMDNLIRQTQVWVRPAISAEAEAPAPSVRPALLEA